MTMTEKKSLLLDNAFALVKRQLASLMLDLPTKNEMDIWLWPVSLVLVYQVIQIVASELEIELEYVHRIVE